MSDAEIEQAILAKGKTAPRVKPDEVQANIIDERYFTGLDGVLGAYRAGGDVHPVGGSPSQEVTQALSLMTFCVLTLRNGFTVHGVSACASPENGDVGVKKSYSSANSVHKQRLAIDLNLFKGGVYQTSTEAHKPLGEYWKSLHPLCRCAAGAGTSARRTAITTA